MIYAVFDLTLRRRRTFCRLQIQPEVRPSDVSLVIYSEGEDIEIWHKQVHARAFAHHYERCIQSDTAVH